jgi:4'-phosphopantetheinyl transferase
MTSQPIWNRPPEKSRLSFDRVHIWRGITPQQPDSSLTAYLSDRERQKGERFLREKDKNQYLFSHGMLRAVLAYYTGNDPRSIDFTQNPFGKPALEPCRHEGFKNELRFNMAHSKDIVVVAVTCRNEVGIDVEYMRDIEDGEMIVSRYFSVEEQKYVYNPSPLEFRKRFFTCWTLKEAFIKALGKGLSYPLDTFSVINCGNQKNDTVLLQEHSDQKWYQTTFALHPSYKAAVVLQNLKPILDLYDFNAEIALVRKSA